MQLDPARSPFGKGDGTPSPFREQERSIGAETRSNGLGVSEADAVTSLVAYREDCGTPPPTCPRQQTVGFWCQDGGYYHLFRVVCKTWNCSYCGPIKRAELAKRVKAAKPNRFVTLTAAPGQTETPREVYDRTRRQISELSKVYRREGKEFEYCRVLEVHESGFPHYHLIVRSPWLDQKELSHRWCQFTQSYIVDVRKLSNDEKGINYVMKYLGKQTENPFTNRRVAYTRNFFEPLPPKEPSRFNPIEVERWAQKPEDVTYYEFPKTSWEKLNHWHWIMRRTE